MAATTRGEGAPRREEDEEEEVSDQGAIGHGGIVRNYRFRVFNKMWRQMQDFDGETEVEVLHLAGGQTDSRYLRLDLNFINGIDTERPILQVDSYVFAGEYEDTVGTCVVFEENTDQVDAEGNHKTELKYKYHTMKKLSMTRTLLIEKKEGEENIGGVEWLQIKDNDFSYRPNMICSFAHQKEDEEVAAQTPDKTLEMEEQEVQTKENIGMGSELEKSEHLEMEDAVPLLDSPSSETEDSTSLETQEATLEAIPS